MEELELPHFQKKMGGNKATYTQVAYVQILVDHMSNFGAYVYVSFWWRDYSQCDERSYGDINLINPTPSLSVDIDNNQGSNNNWVWIVYYTDLQN